MKSLKTVSATAEYTGNTVTIDESSNEDAYGGSSDDLLDHPEEEPEFAQLTGTSTSESDEENDSLPLFILYDCEGTGGAIYTDHIIELAAVVQPLPDNVQIASPLQFQSLVYTAKRIAPVGKLLGSMHIFILWRNVS